MKSLQTIVLGVFLLFGFSVLGQSTDQKKDSISYDPSMHSVMARVNVPSLLLGFNQGKYSFGEVGFGWMSGAPLFGYTKFISAEIGSHHKKMVVAPKIGVWAGMGPGIGLNLLYYTDFHRGTPVFRPEVGLAIYRFKLIYGYNVRLSKYHLPGISTHQVGITYMIQLADR